jgi:hypothetical protein
MFAICGPGSAEPEVSINRPSANSAVLSISHHHAGFTRVTSIRDSTTFLARQKIDITFPALYQRCYPPTRRCQRVARLPAPIDIYQAVARSHASLRVVGIVYRSVEDLEAVIDTLAVERFVPYATLQGVPIIIDYIEEKIRLSMHHWIN